jgi:hypothetical protein
LSPLEARGGDVEDRLDNGAQRRKARPAPPERRLAGAVRSAPFFIRQIACVTQPVTPIFAAGDFSPGHKISSNLANPKESQPAEITQLLFQSASQGTNRYW